MKPVLLISILLLSYVLTKAQQTQIKLDWLLNPPTYYNGGVTIVNDIAVGTDGSVVAVGGMYGTVDFDPGQDTFNVSALSKGAIFIAKYTKTGKLVYAYSFDDKYNESYDRAYAVVLDDEDNAYMTGFFGKPIDFDPGKKTAILAGTGIEAFIASYDKNGLFRRAILVTNSLNADKAQFASSIAVDKEHNVYVTGSFTARADFDPSANQALLVTNGKEDVFLAKYDATGKYVFAKNMGGSEADAGEKIVIDKNNNIVICGYFSSYNADFDPGTGSAFLRSKGHEDIFFAKYNNAGDFLFAKQIGGSREDLGRSVAIGTDNSIVITGDYKSPDIDFDPGTDTFFLTPKNYFTGYVAKYTENGEFKFAFNIGGQTYDYNSDIQTDSSNNIFVVGTSSGTLDFDPGAAEYNITATHSADVFIAKYTSKAGLIFAEIIGNQDYGNYSAPCDVHAIEVDKQGDVIAGGDYADTLDADPKAGIADLYAPAITLFVAKYNGGNGAYINALSADNYIYYNPTPTYLTGAAVDKEGNTYIAGDFLGRFDFDPGAGAAILESRSGYRYSSYFAKYDKKGKLIFAKAIIGGEPYINDIVVDEDENIYLCGSASNAADFDPSDSVQYWSVGDSALYNGGPFFAKYTKNGELVFAKGLVSNYWNEAQSIAVDKKNNIYVVGFYSSSIDFDPGNGSQLLTSIGEEDMFYSKYDSSGNYVFAHTIGAKNNFNEAKKVKLNSKGDIIIIGSLGFKPTDFDPGLGVHKLSHGRGGANFLAIYNNDGSYKNAFSFKDDSTNYPEINVNALIVDHSDNIYIAGDFIGKEDFDPGSNTFYLQDNIGLFIASYTKAGVFRFAKSSSVSTYNTTISNIALDKNNNIYTAGYFGSQQVDCDFGPDTAILVNQHYDANNHHNTELFLAKYDSLGNYLYSNGFDGDSLVGFNYTTAICIDRDGNILYGGNAITKIDFDPGIKNAFFYSNNGFGSLFLAKYSPIATRLAQREKDNSTAAINIKPYSKSSIALYPNPAIKHLSVTIKDIAGSSGKATATIYNAQGVPVLLKQLSITNHNINTIIQLPFLPAGDYFIIIKTKDQQFKTSFIKQ